MTLISGSTIGNALSVGELTGTLAWVVTEWKLPSGAWGALFLIESKLHPLCVVDSDGRRYAFKYRHWHCALITPQTPTAGHTGCIKTNPFYQPKQELKYCSSRPRPPQWVDYPSAVEVFHCRQVADDISPTRACVCVCTT